jgi:hypothetical protein
MFDHIDRQVRGATWRRLLDNHSGVVKLFVVGFSVPGRLARQQLKQGERIGSLDIYRGCEKLDLVFGGRNVADGNSVILRSATSTIRLLVAVESADFNGYLGARRVLDPRDCWWDLSADTFRLE